MGFVSLSRAHVSWNNGYPCSPVAVASHQITFQLFHMKNNAFIVRQFFKRQKLYAHARASAEYLYEHMIQNRLKCIWPLFSEPGIRAKHRRAKGASALGQMSLYGVWDLLEAGVFSSPQSQCILM